jgi:PAS domain S-box-containing protein
MVLRLTPECGVLQGNRAFVDFSGAGSGATAGLLWQALLGPDRARTLATRLIGARGLRAEPAHAVRAAVDRWPLRLDLEARWLPASGHYLCVLHDVTDSRRAELSARARADQFQLLADNVPVLIAYYQASTLRCLFANKRYAQTFGWHEQSIVGHTVAEIIGEPAARLIQPQVDRVLRERRGASYERELIGADGERRWIEVNLLPHVVTTATRPPRFVLISDITKHRWPSSGARVGRAAREVHAGQRRGHRLPQGRRDHRRQPAGARS